MGKGVIPCPTCGSCMKVGVCDDCGWQPIETAPKNTHIFCGHAEKKWMRFGICYAEMAGRWYYSGTSERSQYAQVEGDAPTHWMPLPEPPRAALMKKGHD